MALAAQPLYYLLCRSVASPICQEEQSERNFPVLAFSSRFVLFFPGFFFPDFPRFFLILFSFSRFLANFSLSEVALCPPCHPSGYATASVVLPMVKIWHLSGEFDQHVLFRKTKIKDRVGILVPVRVLWVTISKIKFTDYFGIFLQSIHLKAVPIFIQLK